MSRRDEVQAIVDDLGFVVPADLFEKVVARLEKISDKMRGNCLDPGGSAVRNWVMRELSDCQPIERNATGSKHVTAVLHFWTWDTERYGPQPKGGCGTNVDTMRSPTYRLKDAEPIDRVAKRVARKPKK